MHKQIDSEDITSSTEQRNGNIMQRRCGSWKSSIAKAESSDTFLKQDEVLIISLTIH